MMAVLLTISDVCEILQMSRTCIYDKVRSAELPAIRIKGVLRFDADALQAWIDGQKIPAIPAGVTAEGA